MFHLVLTTRFAGILCYVSAERCLQQGAIISGLARAQLNFRQMPQASRIVCSGIDGSTGTVYVDQTDAALPAFPGDAMRLPAID